MDFLNKKIGKTLIFFIFLILPVIIILRAESFFWVGSRDTGCLAYYGDMVLHGEIPYRDMWDHKTPLIYYLNALLFGIFGSRFRTIAVSEVFWLFAASIFIYKVSGAIFKRNVSLFVTLVFAVYVGTLEIVESFGMTETYLILPAIIAVFSAIKYKGTQAKYFLFISGFMSTAAFLFKQSGALVAFPVILYLAIDRFYEKRRFSPLLSEYLIFITGVLTPLAAFFTYFLVKGALGDCVSQVFVYNVAYSGGNFQLLPALKILFHEIFLKTLGRWPFLIGFAIIGILYKSFDFAGEIKNRIPGPKLREYSLFFMLVSWFFIDLIGVAYAGGCAGHYYVNTIPCLALLGGYTSEYLRNQFKSPLRLLSLLIVFFLLSTPLLHDAYETWSFIKTRDVILNDGNSVEIDGLRYKCDFPLTVRWIMKNTAKDDYIYFWGVETGLNFFTGRKSPSKYTFVAGLQQAGYVKDSDLERFIADFKKNKPKFIIDTSSTCNRVPSLNLKEFDYKESPAHWKLLLPEAEFINDNYIYERTIEEWGVYRRR